MNYIGEHILTSLKEEPLLGIFYCVISFLFIKGEIKFWTDEIVIEWFKKIQNKKILNKETTIYLPPSIGRFKAVNKFNLSSRKFIYHLNPLS